MYLYSCYRLSAWICKYACCTAERLALQCSRFYSDPVHHLSTLMVLARWCTVNRSPRTWPVKPFRESGCMPTSTNILTACSEYQAFFLLSLEGLGTMICYKLFILYHSSCVVVTEFTFHKPPSYTSCSSLIPLD